ncbi:hypothetical protein NKJ55_28745 [Mesorhizobium sp. M0106]|uniref:hypothetical protein n=1 Tax=Mesorhizobium sp. M0106 TaxID=2956880 RepID=UPI00333930DD
MTHTNIDPIIREAEGWALFIFALQVKGRLPPEVDLDEELDDEGMARAMVSKALDRGTTKFENELWGTALFLDRRYNDAPAPIRESALDRVRSVIGDERKKRA